MPRVSSDPEEAFSFFLAALELVAEAVKKHGLKEEKRAAIEQQRVAQRIEHVRESSPAEPTIDEIWAELARRFGPPAPG